MGNSVYVVDQSHLSHELQYIVRLASDSLSLYLLRRRVFDAASTFGSERLLTGLHTHINSPHCSAYGRLRLLSAMLKCAYWFDSNQYSRIRVSLLDSVTADHPNESVEALCYTLDHYASINRGDQAIQALVDYFDWANNAAASDFSPLYFASTYVCFIFGNHRLSVDFAGLAYSYTDQQGSEESKALARFMYLNACRLANGKHLNLAAQYDFEISALEAGSLRLIVDNHVKLPVFAASEELSRHQPDLKRAQYLLSMAGELEGQQDSSSYYAYICAQGLLRLKQGNLRKARDCYEESKLYSKQMNASVDVIRKQLTSGLHLGTPPACTNYTPPSIWAWRKLEGHANRGWKSHNSRQK